MNKIVGKWTMKHCYECTYLSDIAKPGKRILKWQAATLSIVLDGQVWKLTGN